MKRSTLCKLFFSIWLVYLFHYNPSPAGTSRYYFVTMSIVERGTFNIDPYQTNDSLPFGGHVYSDANPGIALAAVPAWAMVWAVYRHVSPLSPLRAEQMHFMLAHLVGVACTSAVAGAATAVLLAQLVYRLTRSRRRAVFTALLYSFGSIAFFFSIRMNQNTVVAALVLLLFILLYDPQLLGEGATRWRFALLGLCGGAAVLVDYGCVALLLVATIAALRQVKGPQDVLRGVAGFLVPMLILALYLQICFHDPLRPPQSHFTTAYSVSIHHHGLFGVGLPDPRYLLAMLISLRLGLFVYMPYLLLSAWYLLTRRTMGALSPAAFQFMRVATAVQLMFISGSVMFQDLFGPRYLLPILPLMVLIFGLGVQRQPTWWRDLLLHASIMLGLLVNIAGAQIGIGADNAAFVVGLWLMRGPWLPIITWLKSDMAPTIHLSILNPGGPLIALCLCVLLIWLRDILNRAYSARESEFRSITLP